MTGGTFIKGIALYSCRADEGLVDPVVNALEKQGIEILKTSANFNEVHLGYDFVLCPCDRKEVITKALEYFYAGVPIISMDQGDTESGSTYDNTGRWVLTRISSLIFTNTLEQQCAVAASGEETWRIMTVGYTFMDGVKLKTKQEICDKYGLPDEYDIVIYNPDVYSCLRTLENMEEIFSLLDKYTIILRPNPDKNDAIVNDYLENHLPDLAKATRSYGFEIIERFEDRNDFLTALKYCSRFIGNSSVMLHEAPYFRVKCFHIGERNKGRPQKVVNYQELGASKRIAKLIDAALRIYPKEKLLRKRVTL